MAIVDFIPAQVRLSRKDAYIYYSIQAAGKRKIRRRIRINHIPPAERKRYAATRIDAINRHLYQLQDPAEFIPKSDSRPVATAFAEYLDIVQPSLRKATFKDYKSVAEHMRSHLAHCKAEFLCDITPTMIHAYFDGLRRKNAHTYNSHLTNLRTMFNFFRDRGWLDQSPIVGIKKMITTTKEREYITLEHRRMLEKHFAAMPHFWMVCMLQYYCFIRRTELARMQMRYFNWAAGVIHLPGAAAKRREKARTVVIPHEYYAMLIAMGYHELPAGFAFAGDNPEFKPVPYRADAVERVAKRMSDVFARARRALRLPDGVKFYSWKDTGITDLADSTGSLLLSQEQAGHETANMTAKYYHMTGTATEKLRSFKMKK